jgi:hypothetical protein
MVLWLHTIRKDRTPPIWLLAVTEPSGRTWIRRRDDAKLFTDEQHEDYWEHVTPGGGKLTSSWRELIATHKVLSTAGDDNRLTAEYDGNGQIVLSVASAPGDHPAVAVKLSASAAAAALRELDTAIVDSEKHLFQRPPEPAAAVHAEHGDVRIDDASGVVVVCCKVGWQTRWKVLGEDPRPITGSGWRDTAEVGHWRYVGNLLQHWQLPASGRPSDPHRRVDRAYVENVADAAITHAAPIDLTSEPDHARIWPALTVWQAASWARKAALDAAEAVLRTHGIHVAEPDDTAK